MSYDAQVILYAAGVVAAVTAGMVLLRLLLVDENRSRKPKDPAE